MADVRTLITEYLEAAKLMQLATVNNNKPWCCSVWFAADDELNLYWLSSVKRRHSREVSENASVAGAIVVPHFPSNPPRGIQFEGQAHAVTDPKEQETAVKIYAGRIYPESKIQSFMTDTERPHNFYKVVVKAYVLFDVVNFPGDPRQELQLGTE